MAKAEMPVWLRVGKTEARIGAISFEPGDDAGEVLPAFFRELAAAVEQQAGEGRAWREIIASPETGDESR